MFDIQISQYINNFAKYCIDKGRVQKIVKCLVICQSGGGGGGGVEGGLANDQTLYNFFLRYIDKTYPKTDVNIDIKISRIWHITGVLLRLWLRIE